MKKWLLAIISIFVVLLAACSDPAPPNGETTKEEESSLSAEEVYEKAMKQLDTLESTAFDMHMEQTMDFGEDEQITTKADFTGELMEDPFTMHQNGSVRMESPAVGKMEINIEMYTQDEVVYVYEDFFNNWIKGTMDDLSNLGLEIGEKQSPFSHFEGLEEFIDDFSFEQTDDTFTYTLETNSDNFKKIIMDELQEFRIAFDGNEDIMEMIDIDELQYAFDIDKETFNLLSFSIDFAINIEEDGEKMTAESSIEADFSDFNKVDEITIPQEVKDDAVDPDDAFGF